MEFTQQHQYAFNKYKNGENIFITGPGGSGKSIFIKKLVKYANNYDNADEYIASQQNI